MTNFKDKYKSRLRTKPRYGGHDPLDARLRRYTLNHSKEHQKQAIEGKETPRMSWHTRQDDGSYECVVRVSNRAVDMGGGDRTVVENHDALIEYYKALINALESGELDQDLLETAAEIKSMKHEALPILEKRFPDSEILKKHSNSKSVPTTDVA